MKVQEHNIIEVKNLEKNFTTYTRKGLFKREKKEVKVINDINFEVKEGEIVGFLGPNGAGKSTSIKIMTGILTPSKGKCLVNGIEPYFNRSLNAKNIGVVFGQRTSLWWDLSVNDNLILLKEMYELTDEEYINRFNYLNSILNFDEILHKQIRTLSLGQRMLADLVASLLHSPKILFLDEPTIGLDIILKEKLLDTLKEINKNDKITIILTTHDMRDVEALCNRIIVINQGNKIFDDDIDKLKKKYVKNRIIKAEIKDCNNIDFSLIKSIEGVEEINLIDNILNVNIINTSKIEKNVIIKLYELFNVKKLEIHEENITSIIKRIYEDR